MLFKSKKPSFEYLRKKWTQKHRHITQNLFDKHLRRVALGSLGGLMLLPASGLAGASAGHVLAQEGTTINADKDNNAVLAAELKGKVPTEVRSLTPREETALTGFFSKRLGMSVAAEIDGKRLNKSYGLIGGEQHLYRYPGDTVYAQAADARDWAMFGGAGMAPGLGAWGYFAPSKEAMTVQDADREKWYIAVQTFLSPGFSENVATYRDFYKYRKMLVVNPQTGQAVVADIAGAGPSEYTGKSLGGSPEVMDALGLGSGSRKGAVLYFFIDDPNNQIPLGPVKVPDEVTNSSSQVVNANSLIGGG